MIEAMSSIQKNATSLISIDGKAAGILFVLIAIEVMII